MPLVRLVCFSLLAGLMLAAPTCAQAAAPRIGGSLTAREVTSNVASGYTRSVTVKWVFSGPLQASGSTTVVSARPTISEYTERYSSVNEAGEYICRNRTFVGWAGGTQPVVQLVFSMPFQNRLTGKARAYLSVPDMQVAARARIVESDCGSAWTFAPIESSEPLISGDDFARNTPVIAGGGLGNLGSGDAVSPAWLVMTRNSAGVWQSSGSRTRSGFNNIGSSRTIKISWTLASARPSNQCALPTRAQYRGHTVAFVRSLLTRSGHYIARLRNDYTARGVLVGRVSSILNLSGINARPCGSGLTVYKRAAR